MILEIKKLKKGLVGSEGFETYRCEVHLNGKRFADIYEAGDGGCLNVRFEGDWSKAQEIVKQLEPQILASDLWKEHAEEFEQGEKFGKINTLRDLYKDPNSVFEFYVQETVQDMLDMKWVQSKQTKNIIYKEKVHGSWIMRGMGWKGVTIPKMLTNPRDKQMVVNKIKEITAKGFKILNTNIPKELYS